MTHPDLIDAAQMQALGEREKAVKATITHEDSAGGHLYYVAMPGRAAGPYRTQRHVQAILDIADDGTLAGIELIDQMPPPPSKRL